VDAIQDVEVCAGIVSGVRLAVKGIVRARKKREQRK
jgi:hypothetical protein